MNKFIMMAAVMLAFTANIFAQSASATASASAVILTPIAISRTADLHFGTATVTAVAGTIQLTPAGVRTATGGVTLYTVAPLATVASFDVTGTASTAYAITLPGSVTISDGSNTMTVNAFASNPSGAGLVLSGAGAQTVTVGATLNVGGSQVPGLYNTGASPFTVTVNYN